MNCTIPHQAEPRLTSKPILRLTGYRVSASGFSTFFGVPFAKSTMF